MKNLITTILCIVHCTLCIGLSAHEEYADSMFRAQIAKEQLTDSTLLDQLNYNLFKAKEYQLKGQINEAVALLVANMDLDSTITYPELYATSAFQLYKILYEAKQYNDAFHFIKIAHHNNRCNRHNTHNKCTKALAN